MKATITVCICLLSLVAVVPLTVQSAFGQGNQEEQVGQILNGRVIDVSSGDTFTMMTPDNRHVEVSLAEIEAPGKGQVYWNESRQTLVEKLLGNEVIVQVVGFNDMEYDNYRVNGQVYRDARWINKEMVKEGWAWHSPQYYQSQELDAAEQQAREQKLGVWISGDPEDSWEEESSFQENPGELPIQPLYKARW